MPLARFSAVAGSAVNVNGRFILYVFGGANITEGEPGLSTVEAYNIATNRWTTKADLPGGLGSINGVGNINGKLYLPGGIEYTGDGYLRWPYLQVYDPAADTWTFGADMPVATSGGVAGVIDNRLYVLAGDEPGSRPEARPATSAQACPAGGSSGTIRYRIGGSA